MTGFIHKIISKNAGQNAKRVVEAMSATELQRRKKITERGNIYCLPCTSIEEQTGRFRQRGYSFGSKVTYVKVYVIFLRENEASILASTGDMCRAYSEVNLKLDCTRFST